METTVPGRGPLEDEIRDDLMPEAVWSTDTKILVAMLAALVLVLVLVGLFFWRALTSGGSETTASTVDFANAPAPLGPTLAAPPDVHALAQALARFEMVVGSIENNTAVLRGVVDTDADAASAQDAALSVEGVRFVDNQLAVLAPGITGTEVSPTDLLHAVASAVGAGVDDVSGVRIRVIGQTAVLTGIVASQADVETAALTALAVNGISAVDNQLVVALVDSQINERLQLSPIRFDTGSATIRPESFATLDEVVLLLQQSNDSLEVQGFTDRVGSAPVNQTLSQERADAVVQYLFSKGVTNRLTAVGYGETERFATGNAPADLAANRRVRFELR